MKFWIVTVFMALGIISNAQKVEYQGATYEVKGETIFKEGMDISETLTETERNAIKAQLNKNIGKELMAQEKVREAEAQALEKAKKEEAKKKPKTIKRDRKL